MIIKKLKIIKQSQSDQQPKISKTAYVKIFNGKIEKGQKLYFYNSKTELEAIDIGYLRPNQVSSKSLDTGYVGYVETGIKNLKEIPYYKMIFLQKSTQTILGGYPIYSFTAYSYMPKDKKEKEIKSYG